MRAFFDTNILVYLCRSPWEARASFYEQQRNNRDFLTISRLDDSTPPRHERAPVAIGLLAAMVLAQLSDQPDGVGPGRLSLQ